MTGKRTLDDALRRARADDPESMSLVVRELVRHGHIDVEEVIDHAVTCARENLCAVGLQVAGIDGVSVGNVRSSDRVRKTGGCVVRLAFDVSLGVIGGGERRPLRVFLADALDRRALAAKLEEERDRRVAMEETRRGRTFDLAGVEITLDGMPLQGFAPGDALIIDDGVKGEVRAEIVRSWQTSAPFTIASASGMPSVDALAGAFSNAANHAPRVNLISDDVMSGTRVRHYDGAAQLRRAQQREIDEHHRWAAETAQAQIDALDARHDEETDEDIIDTGGPT